MANAIVTDTLPSWLESSNTTAFEITTAGGPGDAVQRSPEASSPVYLGTVRLTRMVVITTDPALRPTIEPRYNTGVRPHVRNFAPEYCHQSARASAATGSDERVRGRDGNVPCGGHPSGDDLVTFQWQRNGINLGDGGHYSGSDDHER